MLTDLRHAVRGLLRTPGFTAAAVVTLALGIGANTAIFAIVKAVLLEPLRYPQSDRLVSIAQRHERSGSPEFASLPDYNDWRAESTLLQNVGGAWGVTFNLTAIDEPERLRGALVTASLLPTLGMSPILGRYFTEAEQNERVVVLSHGLWHRRFGGDRAVIGRSVALNGRSHTVVGVMPAGLAFPEAITELWAPLVPEPGMNRGYHLLNVVGRLKSDATLDRARAELSAIAVRSAAAYPEFNKEWGVEVKRLHDSVVASISRPLWMLTGAVACVLLIACANLASLLLSRATARAQEMSIRAALGAGRARLVRQLLTESVVLAAAGGLAGWALASLVISPLMSLTDVPRAEEVSLDRVVLAFTVAVALATVVLFGLVPAVFGSRVNLQQSPKTRGGSARSGILRPALLTFQTAAVVVLLAGAGLLMHSFHRLMRVNSGFTIDRVLTVRFFLPRVTYPVEKCVQLYQQMIDRARAIPGVEAAAATSVFPFSGVSANVPVEFPDRAPAAPGERPGADFVTVTPGYFRLMSIPVLRGRDFEAADRADSAFVAVVNRAMADRHFPNQDPIGQYVRVLGPKPRMIVGVVGDTRQRALHSPPGPEIYIPHTQFPAGQMFLVVRASADEALVVRQLRTEIRALDRDLPVASIRTAEDVLGDSLSSRRFSLILLTLFAVTALALATVGVFGVVSFAVSQRTKEIGIRMALGATAASVLRRTISQGMLPVVAGLVLGLLGAHALTGTMTAMLFETRPFDPLTFIGVVSALLLTALTAAWIPARRASRIDPLKALRYE